MTALIANDADQRTLSVDALDFAPGLLAIQERPPARLPGVILYVTGALFAILLAWAAFGKLDIIATADGRLMPQSYVKIVQPSDSGIVSEILVSEGQSVEAGQVLMRMDPKLAQTDLDTLKSDLAQKSLSLRRIDAELRGLPLLQQSSDPPSLFAQIYAQYRARRQAYLDSVAQEHEVLNKAKNDLIAAQRVRAKLVDTVPLYQQAAASYAKLVKDGFISEIAANEKIRERIEKEQDLKAQEATVASIHNVIAQSQTKLLQIKSSYESQLLNERVEVQSQNLKVSGELAKQIHKTGLLELKAPQAGVVKDLATHTVGTVVSPGTIMMTLVPKGEALLAEVAIKNEDAGFVRSNQAVKLKLAAYPFQKYGMLEGVVDHVSADSNSVSNDQAQKLGNAMSQQMTYKAIIKLRSQQLDSPNSGTFALSPGMQVSAEIHQGQRTVLEYLLSPVQKVVQEAARER